MLALVTPTRQWACLFRTSRKPPRLNPSAAFGFKPATNSAICFAELVEQELIQQGTKRFSVRDQATPPSWLKKSAAKLAQHAQATESFNAASNLASVKSPLHSSINLYANDRK